MAVVQVIVVQDAPAKLDVSDADAVFECFVPVPNHLFGVVHAAFDALA